MDMNKLSAIQKDAYIYLTDRWQLCEKFKTSTMQSLVRLDLADCRVGTHFYRGEYRLKQHWQSGRKVRVKRGGREGVLGVNVNYCWEVNFPDGDGDRGWFIQESELVLIDEEVTDDEER